MSGTGIGSMPGEDFAETMRVVAGELPDFVALPELPARGAPAGMIGRGAALLAEIGVDLQPAGWRLTDAPGIDQRRARSLLARDLDVFEEALQGFEGRVKVQVPGPWTLAASMERPRGDRVLADHGARREVAQSLAEGVRTHIADVRRRVPRAQLSVQVDEPSLVAVLGGKIPTASGFGRHRSIHKPEAQQALREVVEAIAGLDAVPVLHSCAAGLPVELIAGAGFQALGFDPAVVEQPDLDAYARAFDGGLALWPGVVPSVEPGSERLTDARLVERVRGFFSALGYEESSYGPELVVTPSCGLAGASPTWARRALVLSREVARHLNSERG